MMPGEADGDAGQGLGASEAGAKLQPGQPQKPADQGAKRNLVPGEPLVGTPPSEVLKPVADTDAAAGSRSGAGPGRAEESKLSSRSEDGVDRVNEASDESFPASDPPGWRR